MQNMRQDNEVYVAADKTSNFYRMTKENYEEMLLKNVTNEYKKSSEAFVSKVNNGDKKIAEELEIDDRVYKFQKSQTFVTIKDHKDNFRNNTKCRLINSAKPELGKVSKKVLSRVVSALKAKTQLKQWKNSFSVIEWFKSLGDKKTLSFIQFDIVEFYPSISEKLLKDALNYAKNLVELTKDEIQLILQTKQAILFNKNQPWVKKGGKSFNVTMGSYDGAETADLVGLYLLSQLSKLNLNIGLYRDDGLAVCNLKPRQAELTRKKLCEIFKENGLKITSVANVKNVNFLDINLDLEKDTFSPYMKPNDKPVYVHADSNHPRSILEYFPRSVNKRLSSISSSQEVFEKSVYPYQEALKSSGYSYQLRYDPEIAPPQKNQKNQIIEKGR